MKGMALLLGGWGPEGIGMAARGGVVGLVLETGPVAKVILLLLLALSVVSWAVIFHKYRAFRRAARDDAAFEGLLQEGTRLAEMQGMAARLLASPRAALAREAHRALRHMTGGEGNPGPSATALPPTEVREGVSLALEKAIGEQVGEMERYVIFLAVTATAAPFLGLLGTVWGIMEAFLDIGTFGAANITVVAPGIAEALIVTAAGLAAAIPAVMGYNYFVGKSRAMARGMEGFSADLLARVLREMGR